MKRGFHRSRSDSDDHRKYYRNRSNSRSRDKQNKKQSSHNTNRGNNYRLALAKVQSDIRNHFRFRLPTLTSKEEEEDTVAMLKSKLNEKIGPVEHITRSRETMTLNLGFKYDIDAISFLEMLQTGRITVKTSEQKIQLQPTATHALQSMIKAKREQTNGAYKNEKNPQQKGQSRSNLKQSPSCSSSSSSNKRSNLSDSQSSSSRVYGVPAHAGTDKVFGVLGHSPGGPFKLTKPTWKQIKGSVCQYLEFKVDSQKVPITQIKADILIKNCGKLEVDGRPIIVIQQSQRPGKQLLNYQIQIQFPKPIHPSKVLKNLQSQCRIIQIIANEQIQQDGKYKSYIITLNDPSIASQFKKLGDLNCGIWVGQPKIGQLVYRPVQPLPLLSQL